MLEVENPVRVVAIDPARQWGVVQHAPRVIDVSPARSPQPVVDIGSRLVGTMRRRGTDEGRDDGFQRRPTVSTGVAPPDNVGWWCRIARITGAHADVEVDSVVDVR